MRGGAKSVILLSGGMDSVTLLYLLHKEGHAIHSITFDYEQRNRAEILAARDIATALPVRSHLKVEVGLGHIGFSPLTSEGIPLPRSRTIEEIRAASGMSPMYVPGRNTIFLSMALALAGSVRASSIYFAANAEDNAGFPDCRREFVEAFQAVADRSGVNGVTVEAPFLDKSKAEIVALGKELGVPYEKTISCYVSIDGSACGVCDACVLRKSVLP